MKLETAIIAGSMILLVLAVLAAFAIRGGLASVLGPILGG